jgi:uncharacterized delta-60 repeat protein
MVKRLLGIVIFTLWTSALWAIPGDPDLSFGTNGITLTPFPFPINAAAAMLEPDGKIVVTGVIIGADGPDVLVVRYTPEGSLDTTFGSGGVVVTDVDNHSQDFGEAVALQGEKIVVAGDVSSPIQGFLLLRYNPDGSLDPSFDGDGKVVTPFLAEKVAAASTLRVSRTGKLFAGGMAEIKETSNFAVARYLVDGALDPGFGGGDGKVTLELGGHDVITALTQDAANRLVVAGIGGPNNDIALARFKTNGSRDLAFGTGGKVLLDLGGDDVARAVGVRTSGEIVVAGFRQISDNTDFAIAQFLPNGSLDPSFGVGGKVVMDLTPGATGSDLITSLAITPGSRLLVAGTSCTDLCRYFIARFLPAGTIDGNFLGGMIAGKEFAPTTNSRVTSLLVRPQNGKVVVVGTTDTGVALARFHTAECQDKDATLVGTSGADTLVGTAGDDVIVGFAGNDTIQGGGGNDTICGGVGTDTCDGGDGIDTVVSCETTTNVP